MATPSAIHNEPVSAAKVDMKFEVIVIPVADVDRRKRFTQSLGGGLMQISHSTTDSGSSNSRLPARGARSNSARR
jgi:hypothetical protein